MEQLDAVIKHLQQIDKGWYGEIKIKIRDGRAVLIIEERTHKLGEEGTDLDAGNPKTE